MKILNWCMIRSWWLVILFGLTGIVYAGVTDEPVILTNFVIPITGVGGIITIVFLAGKTYTKCVESNKSTTKVIKNLEEAISKLETTVFDNNKSMLMEFAKTKSLITELNVKTESQQRDIDATKRVQENCKFIHRDPFEFVTKV